MNRVVQFLVPVAAVALLAPSVSAELLKCMRSKGCEARLWDAGTQSWGKPEPVPRGTIIDSEWGMGWGEGWNPAGSGS